VSRDQVGRLRIDALSRLEREGDGVLRRERLEVERQRVGDAAGPVRALLQEVPSGDAQDHQRNAPRLPHCLLHELEEGRLREMEILEDHDDRFTSRETGEEAHEAGADLRDAVLPLLAGVGAETERHPEAADDLLRLHGLAHTLDGLLELLAKEVRLDVALDAELAAHHLRERRERLVLLQRARATRKHLRSGRKRVAELLRDPALSDAGLSEERDEVRARGLRHPFERVGEERQLALAVDERDRPPRRPRREADDRPGADRSLEPLRDDVAARTHFDLLADEVTRRLSEEDLPGLRGLLQPSGEVHGGAEDHASHRRIRDDRDRTRVDTDPQAKGQRQPETFPERRDTLLDVERRANGAERVVVVRRRNAEYAEDGVAREVLRASLERLQLVDDLGVVRRHHAPEALGIQPRRELRRAGEVDEHDRDDLALLHVARQHRRATIRTEAGVRGKRLSAVSAGLRAHPSSIRAGGVRSEPAAVLDQLERVSVRIEERGETREALHLSDVLVERDALSLQSGHRVVEILHLEYRGRASRGNGLPLVDTVERDTDRTAVELGPRVTAPADEPQPEHVGVERRRAIHVGGPVIDVVDAAKHALVVHDAVVPVRPARVGSLRQTSRSPREGSAPSAPGTPAR
jgi:hypothetical protein